MFRRVCPMAALGAQLLLRWLACLYVRLVNSGTDAWSDYAMLIFVFAIIIRLDYNAVVVIAL